MSTPEKNLIGELLIKERLVSPGQLQTALEEQKRTGQRLGSVFIDKGIVTEKAIVETLARPGKVRLGELLVREKLITQDQLQTALDEQKRTGRRLGRSLIDKGVVTEEAIAEALARQFRAPFVNLKTFTANPKLVGLLPETQARRLRVLVLEETPLGVRVGMADPTDLTAYDEIVRIIKRDVALAVVTESALLATIDRVYRRTDEIVGLAQQLEAELATGSEDFGTALGLSPGVEDAPVVKLLQTIFEDAVGARASDVHIEPQEHKLQIRFRIDGVLQGQTEADIKIAPALALRLKLMSGLDISEKRLPQDGRFHVKVRDHRIDVRISTMPTQYGESVVMRLLNQNSGLLGLDRLGLPDGLLDRIRAIVAKPNGMLLVTGPTGSGKTTTLYATLNELNTPNRKIITVEDPIEYRLPGINQVQVHEKIDLSFARVLRSTLRQDPDVLLIGEMRDQATVETGLRAAMTGHMVLSTLHTNDAASTPMRLLDMGAPKYMVASSLRMVLAQRLVRAVCDVCRVPHAPTPAEQEWLAAELGESFDASGCAHGAGCGQCNGTGFVGRTGVYEALEMNQRLLQAVNRGDVQAFAEVATGQMAGQTMRRHAALLALAGRTTVSEAMHVGAEVDE
jgi:MSHA biogenesis protein MshE